MLIQILARISDFIIPCIIFGVVAYGMAKQVKVYECFRDGAQEGLKTVVGILPTLIGLMIGVGILRASGFFDILGNILAPITTRINLPTELIPLLSVKMFSSSAATGLVLDIFREYGPDSYVGLAASLMLSCTETIFYTMSVYFLAAKVTKTRYTLKGALLTTLIGTICSILFARGMLGM